MGRKPQGLREHLEASKLAEAGKEKRPPPQGNRDRSVSEASIFAYLSLGNDLAERLGTTKIDTETPDFRSPTAYAEGELRDFCRGQPPNRSFLSAGEQSPPRFRMARRSTLADRPELDGLLKAGLIAYKGGEYLSLDANTVHRLSQYLNGSKPLAHICLFKRLMITSDVKKVNGEYFVAVLQQIGVYCEYLAVIAPFHAIELGNVFDRDIDNLEAGSDWEKILQCLPNLNTLIFQHRTQEPTNLSRDTFYALLCALHSNKDLLERVQLDVPNQVLWDYHHDFHTRQRQNNSPHSSSTSSSPLTIVGQDMIYADGPEDYWQLDDEHSSVFGEVDAIHTLGE